MLNHFCHVELQTTNMAKAAEFYRTLFHWRIEQSIPGQGYWMIWAEDGRDLGSLKKVDKIDNTGTLVYVHVEHIDETIRRSAKLGGTAVKWCTPLENPEWGSIGILQTEDGYQLGLWSKEGQTPK